jgi:hypothetical protein
MDRTTTWRAATILVVLGLLWRAITVNALLYDDTGRPRLEGARGESDPAALVAILQRNPAEVAALLAIAEGAERAGAPDLAARAYKAAVGIAPVDRDALALSAQFFLRQGRGSEAVTQLDRLVENYGEYDKVFPVFAQLLAARDPAVMAIAARNPTWLGAFVVDACQRGIDSAIVAAMLQIRGAGARVEEVDCVTTKLRMAGRWEESYQVWLNSLPPERLKDVGYVFNGSFEFPPSGVGFDWRLARGSERELGHSVMLAPSNSGSGQRALRVIYNGKRQAGVAAEQYLAVPPGRYEFSGLARMDKLNSVRGVQWTLKCARTQGEPMPIANSERFLGALEWQLFAFEVVIPEGCTGQVLRLEPVGMNEGAVYLAGTAWFDELRLTRAR